MIPVTRLEEAFPETPVNRTVKEPVTLSEVKESVCISGALSAFAVALIVYKRFTALEDYASYASRLERRKDPEDCEEDVLEMLPFVIAATSQL